MIVESLFVVVVASLLIFAFKSQKNLYKSKDKAIRIKEETIQEIRFEDRIYDVTDGINQHPGGRKIEFYTNNDEDASIAIQQFHNRSIKKVLLMLKTFKSRPVPEKSVVTKMELRNKELTNDFYELFKELQDEGLFKPSLLYVSLGISELIVLDVLGMIITVRSGSSSETIAALIILSLFQIRSAFLTHETGHYAFTGSPKIDRIIASICHGSVNGLSGSWWRNQHNKHHGMPQRLDHDVDLKTLPLIAFNVKVVKGNTHLFNFCIRHQAKLMAPIISFLVNLGWKLHTNPTFAFKKKQYVDLFSIGLHIFYGYQIGFLNYLIVQAIFSSALLITFSISHSYLPVTEKPSHWVEYCTIHTMNVHPSWWCDYWMGYLNYQIEHHFFPTLPQFRLRSIKERVESLVRKHDLPYTCDSYSTACRKSFNNLSAVASKLQEQAKLASH